MSVASLVNSIAYAGNASTVTPYAIPFRFDDPAWLRVIKTTAAGISTFLEPTTGYTLAGDGSASTATLRTVAAVADTDTLAISRMAPALQQLELVPNSPLPSAALEKALDQFAMSIQDFAQVTRNQLSALVASDVLSQAVALLEGNFDPAVFAKTAVSNAFTASNSFTAATFSGAVGFSGSTTFSGSATFSDSVTFSGQIDGNMAIDGNVSGTGYGLFDQLIILSGGASCQGDATFNAAATFNIGPILLNGQVKANRIENVVKDLTGLYIDTIDWDLATGNLAVLTNKANLTLANPTNVKAGIYILKVTQDATGNRTLAYGTAYKFAGGTDPVLSTAANAVDVLTFANFGDNSNLYLISPIQKALS